MEKFLVTGVNGFVAKHFIDFLENCEVNSEVIGIGREDVSNTDLGSKKKNHYYNIDLNDSNSLNNLIDVYQPDYLLHLASNSSVGESWKYPDVCINNNINIFLNVVESVRNFSKKTRILSVGSSEQYGTIDLMNTPISESFNCNSINPYGLSKISQEMIGKLYSNSYDLDIVMTRSFNHIGVGQNERFVIPSFIKQAVNAYKRNEKYLKLQTGNVYVVRDFLDVKEVVKSYYLLLKKGIKGEVYNVCSGKGIALIEIIKIIEKKLNIVIEIQENSNLIRPNEIMTIIGDNNKLKNTLGWIPTQNIEDTIEDIINSMLYEN